MKQDGAHRFTVAGRSIAVRFGDGDAPDAVDVFRASERHWQRFWSTGGAVDLSGSADPRARELERRIVLSQHLTAINCSGSATARDPGAGESPSARDLESDV